MSVRALEKHTLPDEVECLDGGTGGFILLEPLQERRPHHPDRCSGRRQSYWNRYPHDAALLARLSAHAHRPRHRRERPAGCFLHPGRRTRDVILYAITIDPHQPISMSLSPIGAQAADDAVQRILAELEADRA